MKRKLISIFLSLCMVVGLAPLSALAAEPKTDEVSQSDVTDVTGHWAEEALETWAAHDVLKGFGGALRPDDPITRAELAAVLNRVIGYTDEGSEVFTDVPADAWYHKDIAKLHTAGLMQGDGSGAMRPLDNITREEAAVLIARAFDVAENAGNEASLFRCGRNFRLGKLSCRWHEGGRLCQRRPAGKV